MFIGKLIIWIWLWILNFFLKILVVTELYSCWRAQPPFFSLACKDLMDIYRACRFVGTTDQADPGPPRENVTGRAPSLWVTSSRLLRETFYFVREVVPSCLDVVFSFFVLFLSLALCSLIFLLFFIHLSMVFFLLVRGSLFFRGVFSSSLFCFEQTVLYVHFVCF